MQGGGWRRRGWDLGWGSSGSCPGRSRSQEALLGEEAPSRRGISRKAAAAAAGLSP